MAGLPSGGWGWAVWLPEVGLCGVVGLPSAGTGGGVKKQRPAISGITGRQWFRLAGGEGFTPLVLLRAASTWGWRTQAPVSIDVGLGQPHASP